MKNIIGLNRNHKRLISILMMLAIVASTVFAAGDDTFGINDALSKVKTFLYAIGGACIIISVSVWAIKGIIKKNIAPQDWTAIIAVMCCGLFMVAAPTIVESLFSGSLGGLDI